MKSIYLTSFIIGVLLTGLAVKTNAQATQVVYLSGIDKDHTVKWDFFCTTGRNSGHWDKIQVPSNWELQGFGTFNYFQDTKNPDEQGLYKYHFNRDAAWR